MSMARLRSISLWLVISMLLALACKEPKATKVNSPEVIEQPKPISDPQIDSLKNYLDQERARRKP
jgi:hypothetical protein